MNEKKLRHHVYNECMSSIPHKIIRHHTMHNLAEFVLHTLCHEAAFNLNKAAYLVKSPDFHCIKGITGYHAPEAFDQEKIWDHADDFSRHMQHAPFNKKVRQLYKDNLSRTITDDEQLVNSIAQELSFTKPAYHTIPLKHDNIGLLVYQGTDEPQDHLQEGFNLLSLCPLF